MFEKKYRTFNSRQYKRLHADYLVKYQLAGFDAEPYVSNIKDISAGGMRFWTDKIFPEGAFLNISVLFPPSENEIRVLGKILRVRQVRHGNFNYVAISFLEMSREDQQTLNDFIERLSLDPESAMLIDQHDIVERKIEALYV